MCIPIPPYTLHVVVVVVVVVVISGGSPRYQLHRSALVASLLSNLPLFWVQV